MKKTITKLVLTLLLLSVFAAVPLATQGADVWVADTAIEDGETYLFVYAGSITDGAQKNFGACVLKSVSANQHGLAYANRPSGTVPKEFLWKVESAGGGKFYFKSEANGKYLNMAPGANGKGFATLEDSPMALNAVIQSGNLKITANLGGATYYVRFTTTYHKTEGSCWEASTGTNSNEFRIYRKGETVEEFEESGSPYFSVACFSDLHVDYGIQGNATPIRTGTIKAAQYVQENLGGAHVVLVGGDILSNNDYNKNYWNTARIKSAQQAVYDTMSMASKDGKVLLVAGNHDYEAGTMSKDGDVYNSADYERYMTGAVGSYDAVLYQNDLNPSYGKYNELLGYRYRISGIDFIGINTPYRTGKVDGGLFRGQITWLDEQLDEIGKDRTVVVLCHYPVNMIPDQAGENYTTQYMQEVLKKYPNVIYCYGHVHGSDSYYAWYNTSELILNDGNRTRLENNAYETEGYITAHMGSMAYYNTQFQSGWLTAAEPMINQNLMIDFYEDHITFKYYNHGVKSAVEGVYDITSFTVMRDLRAQFGSEGQGPTNWDEYFGDSEEEDTSSGSQGGNSSGSQGGNPSGSQGNGSSDGSNSDPSDGPSSDLPTEGTDSVTDSNEIQSGNCENTDSQPKPDSASSEDGSSDGSKHSDGNGDGDESSSLLLPLLIGGGVLVAAGGGSLLWFLLRKKRK
ncbi:MAG: metallophosphoesterase [Clostridia bacterium]|nr:metallophosphoesterase [Clostridia bacterium]